MRGTAFRHRRLPTRCHGRRYAAINPDTTSSRSTCSTLTLCAACTTGPWPSTNHMTTDLHLDSLRHNRRCDAATQHRLCEFSRSSRNLPNFWPCRLSATLQESLQHPLALQVVDLITSPASSPAAPTSSIEGPPSPGLASLLITASVRRQVNTDTLLSGVARMRKLRRDHSLWSPWSRFWFISARYVCRQLCRQPRRPMRNARRSPIGSSRSADVTGSAAIQMISSSQLQRRTIDADHFGAEKPRPYASARFHLESQRAQRRGEIAAAGIVEERARGSAATRAPAPAPARRCRMRAQPVLEQLDDADAGDRRIDAEIGRRPDAHDQRAGRLDLDDPALSLELPRRYRAACERPRRHA